jgi:hypothetical protein
MTLPPDRELLTQAAARQLLERAGEIDADSTSVDALRAAAREAGISEAAFEAALVEMRGRTATAIQPATVRSRRKRLIFAAIVAAVIMVGSAVLVVIPTRAGRAQTGMVDHEFVVQCLPMRTAQDIARTVLTSPENQMQMSPGSRVMRVRATPEQFNALQAAFASNAKTLASCDNTPAGR